MGKFKYPEQLMHILGMSSHSLIDEKTMYNNILNKCTKVYGSKYKITRNLYNILNPTDNNDLESSDSADYIFIRTYDIRQYLKKLAIIHVKNNNYIEVGKILSDIPIKYLEVLVI